MSNFVILIPTYNEAQSIIEIIPELNKLRNEGEFQFDLVVIDDNSPDKTADVVEKLALPWVNVMRRPSKDGLGEAYRAGFSQVLLNSSYTHVVTMDADGSHRVEDLALMFKTVQKLSNQRNIIMGTRWMPGGRVINWPKYRQFISKFGTRYAKFALNIDLDDLTGGFRIYSSELLNSLDLKRMKATGYCFQIEMALASMQVGAEVIQVPITFVERNFGKSKMTTGIAIEAFIYVTKAGFERVSRLDNRR